MIWVVVLFFVGLVAVIIGTRNTVPVRTLVRPAAPTISYIQRRLESVLGRTVSCTYTGRNPMPGRAGLDYTCYESGSGRCAGDQQYRVIYDPRLGSISYGYVSTQRHNTSRARCP